MKKYIPNPHFLLFGFFVLIVISSGSSVKAQEERKISQSIIIKNGDTIINGKKLSEVDNELEFKFNFKMDGLDSNLRKRIVTMHRDMDVRAPGVRNRMMPPRMFEEGEFPSVRSRNNSSSFNYNYIDKDGISNHMNIRISDAEKDRMKSITGSESIVNPLDVSDIMIFPNFSSGKLGLSFHVASRGNTKIKILDSELKLVFSDEAANFTGSYMKHISLPKNGIYYISINQNSNWFVKKLIKD